MNHTNSTIEQMLRTWGKQHQVAPQNNALLKSTVLQSVPLSVSSPKVPKRSWGLPALSVLCTGLALIVFVVLSPHPEQTSTAISSPGLALNQSFNQSGSGLTESFDSLSKSASSIANPERVYPSPITEVPITDTREFLKTDYSATVRSRHVGNITERLQTIARGLGGRIDAASSSENSGYVRFVLPANKLDAFRAEARALLGERFILEHLQTQNLLPQKQDIESQALIADESLVRLKAEQGQLTADHEAALRSLNAQILRNKQERARLVAELENYPDRSNSLQSRISGLDQAQRTLADRLSTENATYASRLNTLSAQIQNTQANRDAVTKQDGQLLDNVATVQGYILVTPINIWQFVDTYVPFRVTIPLLLLCLAFTAYIVAKHG